MYAKHNKRVSDSDVENTKQSLCELCGITSRKELDTSYAAAKVFAEIRTEYRNDYLGGSDD